MRRLDRILYIAFMTAVGAVMLALLVLAYMFIFSEQREATALLGKIILCVGLSIAGLSTINLVIYLIKYTGRKN